jgi:hypothetical protein
LRKGIFSVIILMACGFWMQRNMVVFDNEAPHVADFLATIQTETRHWVVTGAAGLVVLLPAMPSI